ncbi:MAG: hypothetical protein U0172_04660 [Nitrospiraceae bacterium]
MRRLVQSLLGLTMVFLLSSVVPVSAEQATDPHQRPGRPGAAPAPIPMVEPGVSIQALAAVNESVVYAGSFGAGMFRSDNRGTSWVADAAGLTDTFVLSMTVGQNGTVYAGTFRGGVFRRTTSGTVWEPINEGLKRLEVKALLASQGYIYAGTADGVYRRKDAPGAQTWTVVSSGLDDILVHALGRANDGTLFAGTSGKGVLRHREQKAAKPKSGADKESAGWVRLRQGLKDHEGLVENYIRVITLSRSQALYIGTFDGGVFLSEDLGETWRPISRALPNDSIRGILSADGRLIVATGRGIFRTDNNGQKWVPLNKGLTELSIQALVSAGERTLYAGTSGGAFRSDDEGGTWVEINQGLQVRSESPFSFQ